MSDQKPPLAADTLEAMVRATIQRKEHDMFINDEFDRKFRNTERFITGVFIVQVIVILFVLAGAIAGITYAAKEIKVGGVRGLVEKVWNGPDHK